MFINNQIKENDKEGLLDKINFFNKSLDILNQNINKDLDNKNLDLSKIKTSRNNDIALNVEIDAEGQNAKIKC